MNELMNKLGLAALFAAAALFFTACSNDNEFEDAAEDLGDAVENVADGAGDAAEEAADKIEDATN